MADTDPTIQGGPATPPPDPGPGSGPGGQPGGPTAAEASAAMQAKWGAMGQADRLIVAGAAVLIVGYILGMVLEGWGLGLTSLLTFLGAIVVLVVVLVGYGGMTGLSRTTILRVSAAVAAAFSLADVGDMLSSLNSWSGLDIVLSAIVDIAAFVVLWGVWLATSGDPVKDAIGLLSPGERSMPQWLVAIGSGAVLISWFVLELGSVVLRDDTSLAVLAAILALTVLWAAAAGSDHLKLPVASGLVLAGLAVIAVIFALIWLGRAVNFIDELSIVAWLGLILFVGGAAAMAAGGLLGLQENRSTPTA